MQAPAPRQGDALHHVALQAATDGEAALVLADALDEQGDATGAQQARRWAEALHTGRSLFESTGWMVLRTGSTLVTAPKGFDALLPRDGAWVLLRGTPYQVVRGSWQGWRCHLHLDRPWPGDNEVVRLPSPEAARLREMPFPVQRALRQAHGLGWSEEDQALQELLYVASLRGVAPGDVHRALRGLARSVSDAQRQGPFERQFARLGIPVTAPAFAEATQADQIEWIADGLMALPPPQQAETASLLFGTWAISLWPLFELRGEGIRYARREARALGLAMADH